MSDQTNSAAERSAHVSRGGPAKGEIILPVVETAPGVFRLRVVVELEARIAELERELAREREWRVAVENAMVTWEMLPGKDEAPSMALHRLLTMETAVALDHRVSREARMLVEAGFAKGISAAVRRCEQAAETDDEVNPNQAVGWRRMAEMIRAERLREEDE